MKNDIELTIALPMYRAKHIAWVAMESLCRQEGVNFAWELIVAEEKEPLSLGEDGVVSYEKRLEKVGCVSIKYISLDNWIPLGMKWKLMAENSSDSIMFLLVAADIYNSPYRLQNVYASCKNGDIHWYHTMMHLLYELKTGNTYTLDTLSGGHVVSADMAISTPYVKRIPNNKKKKSVDKWLYSLVKGMAGDTFRTYVDKSNTWEYNFNIHGLNNLSKRNFGKSAYRLSTHHSRNLPADILKRLISIRDLSGTMERIGK